MLEIEVENILMGNTHLLGYPRAEVMRNVVLVPGRGRADVLLLPASGLHRLVVIEVKRAAASDAGDKVIGQLLKYYAHALTLGTKAVERFREYARDHQDHARSVDRKTPQSMFKALRASTPLMEILHEGRPLRPAEVALYVATDGEPSEPLKQILTILAIHHQLQIGAIRVDADTIRVLVGGDVTKRMP